MDQRKAIWSRLIIAIPELNFDPDIIKKAVDLGLVDAEFGAAWQRTLRETSRWTNNLIDADKKNTIMGKLMAIVPELVSVPTIDLLRYMDVIDVRTANILRATIAGANKAKPIFSSEASILQRVQALYGATTTSYMFNLLRDLESASIKRQAQTLREANKGRRLTDEQREMLRDMDRASILKFNRLRSATSQAEMMAEAVRAMKASDSLWSAMTILFTDPDFGFLSDKTLRNAIRAGMISRESYTLIRTVEQFGANAWRKVDKARQYENNAARMIILSEGVLSHETLNLLKQTGYISEELRDTLRPVITIQRLVTRQVLTKYTGQRTYRNLGKETPIQTYARSSVKTDQQVLRLLKAAAVDTEKSLQKAGTGIGAKTRSAQQRILVNSIHRDMRRLWEGLGYLTIIGEKEAANAAADSVHFMQNALFKGADAEWVNRTLRWQAQAGVQAFIGREENVIELSGRVYKNLDLSMGLVEREIQKGLIRGLSAQELAKNVSRMIRPDVPGGVSYAAMRLARTEINNAFHHSQIAYSRDMPWVQGYKWHLSGSHPKGRPDVCNTMSERNHDGIGKGVYKKGNVPGKPHPHCLCYITAVDVDNKTFYKRIRSGAYNDYINKASKTGMDDFFEHSLKEQVQDDLSKNLRKAVKTGVIVGSSFAATWAIRNPDELAKWAHSASSFAASLRSKWSVDGLGAASVVSRAASREARAAQKALGAGPSATRAALEGGKMVAQHQVLEEIIGDKTVDPALFAQKYAVQLRENTPVPKVVTREMLEIESDKSSVITIPRAAYDRFMDKMVWEQKQAFNAFHNELYGPMNNGLRKHRLPEAITSKLFQRLGVESWREMMDDEILKGKAFADLVRDDPELGGWAQHLANLARGGENDLEFRMARRKFDFERLSWGIDKARSRFRGNDDRVDALDDALYEAKKLWGLTFDSLGKPSVDNDAMWEQASEGFMDLLDRAAKSVGASFPKYPEKLDLPPSQLGSLTDAQLPENFYKIFDQIFTVRAARDSKIYRVADEKWAGGALEVGAAFKDLGYAVAGTTAEGLEKVAQGKIRYEIRMPKGSKFAFGNQAESEIVLPRGSRFRILSVVKNADNARFAYDVIVGLVQG